jgi:nitronate monooxygenase
VSLDPEIRSALRLPAVCAPMYQVSGPALAREAARAGIIGGLARQNASSLEEFERWLRSIREALNAYSGQDPAARVGPVAVNLSGRVPADELRANLEACRRHGVKIIVSAMGNPAELVKVVHDWGGVVFHDATSVRFAEKGIEAGVDGLNCIGAGGGGHSGTVSLMTLIPRVRAMFGGTIVAAGAISTGSAIRAVELLGADLAYLGTRFIATQESLAPDEYKRLLVSQRTPGLRYTPKVTGVPASWLVESYQRLGVDLDAIPEEVVSRSYDHLPAHARPWKDIWSAGQGIELIGDIPTVAELVRRLRHEYVAACQVPDLAEQARDGQ